MKSGKLRSICVFSGSSFGQDPAFERAAGILGSTIAERGYTLVYGGASVGLMGSLAEAALTSGGKVVGVLPRALSELEIAHTSLTELHVVESMHARKTMMADIADAFIAMPGGLGTLEETFEVWTWTQLGIHTKPIGFLNVEGYFDDLFAFLDHSVSSGFVKPKHREMAIVSSAAAELLDRLESADITYEAKWIDKPAR